MRLRTRRRTARRPFEEGRSWRRAAKRCEAWRFKPYKVAKGRFAGRYRIEFPHPNATAKSGRYQELLPAVNPETKKAWAIADVNARLRDARGALDATENVTRGAFAEALDAYVDGHEKKRSARTRKLIASQVKRSNLFRGAVVEALTVDNVRRYLAGMEKAGTAPATRNRHRAFLLAAARYFAEVRMLPLAAHADLSLRVKKAEEPPRHWREWTPAEERAMCAAASPELRRLIRAGLHTGRRVSELISLTKADVDLEEREPSYRPTLHKTNQRPTMTLTSDAAEVLREAMDASKCEHVFVTSKGRPWTASGVRSAYVRARSRAGKCTECIKGEACKRKRKCTGVSDEVQFHGLRATFNNRARRDGLSATAASTILGHSSTRTTERHYTSVTSAETNAEIRALDAKRRGAQSELEKLRAENAALKARVGE